MNRRRAYSFQHVRTTRDSRTGCENVVDKNYVASFDQFRPDDGEGILDGECTALPIHSRPVHRRVSISFETVFIDWDASTLRDNARQDRCLVETSFDPSMI